MADRKSVLIIYTGGTIGMVKDPGTGSLKPFNFDNILEQVPELKEFDLNLETIAFDEPLDSSDLGPDIWCYLARTIQEQYQRFDGFVILHGSDTMAYTASALSFMLENLGKPVILTGSQLPIGVTRTDGKENIITSIEIAASYENDEPVVPEVAIYFEFKLLRGNRTYKFNAEHFDAFRSDNHPPLAQAGVHIRFDRSRILPVPSQPLIAHEKIDRNIATIQLFPGIKQELIQAILDLPGVKGIALQTFGAGNAMTDKGFLYSLEKAIQEGKTVMNVTQCRAGPALQGMYEASSNLERIGVISGNDITIEAAVTKMMYLLGNDPEGNELRQWAGKPLRGEMSTS